ncbi:anthranilate synthase [bacterium SM23_31]|nr:MAG: anthranilate synthase [bacterium SM23_31]
MILVIDNYDSFTYNLVQYVGETGAEVNVVRNDEITLSDIREMNPAKIIISPGPGRPENSGICPKVIREYGETVPILGVCLGHQAIGYVFGGTITRAERLMHGKTSRIFHDSENIYTGIENPFIATRYHSLIVSREGLPECFTISAESEDGTVMGIRHKTFPLEGVQFHPESILTTDGKRLLLNFLSL